MTDTTHDDIGRIGLDGAAGLFAARMATALVQGLVLYGLYLAADKQVWPVTQPALFGALTLAAGYAPVVVLAGVGKLSRIALSIWTAVAMLALALLGWHDVAREVLAPDRSAPFLSFPVLAFGAAALFIAHHLITPAVRARRWVADYHDYFDIAWKAGVQLALSLGFTGTFWLLLHLGASLFEMIGLPVLRDLLRQGWFFIPVTVLVFATAVQLTDVRDGLIRGVRTVALMLLSWLLLVITVLTAGFLLALPFTGLEGLWRTRSATALVLAAAAALIVLINTAYQDGRANNRPPLVLRHGVRVASVLIAPLAGLAFWGLALRIGQHGLTPDRVIALACAVVGTVHGAGYLVAALKPGAWMKPLERTNVAAAVLAVGVILALFTPLADPARLSVSDQMARLERGVVPPQAFDYDFLAFESGKAGRQALTALSRSKDPQIATRARAAEAKQSRYAFDIDRPKPSTRPNSRRPQDVRIDLLPATARLPDSFAGQFARLSPLLDNCTGEKPCVARQIDRIGSGPADILIVAPGEAMLFRLDNDGKWNEWVKYRNLCDGGANLADAYRQDRLTAASPAFPNLAIDGRSLSAEIGADCPGEGDGGR